jgi:hypothetical protein
MSVFVFAFVERIMIAMHPRTRRVPRISQKNRKNGARKLFKSAWARAGKGGISTLWAWRWIESKRGCRNA